MDSQNKIIKITLSLSLGLVALMWLVYGYDNIFHLDLYKYGVKPRTLSGLIGIITSPFIHSTNGFSHIFNNSIPAFVLTWLLFYNYRNIAFKVFIIIFLGTGLLVWIFGRDSYHIGMSGVIYGLTSFLMICGFLTKNLSVAAISLLVIFLYGSLIWGIFPLTPGVSFEGHFFGFFVGAILAIAFRKQLPQPVKYRYEIEEELEIESLESQLGEEYWKTPETPAPHTVIHPHSSTDPLNIVYQFKVKEQKEEEG